MLPKILPRSASAKPIEAGMEVFTSRGYGKVVCRFRGDGNWPVPDLYVVELDDDGGRMPVRGVDLQVVDRSAT